MKKMLLLYNPVAGDRRIQNSLSDLVNQMTGMGYLVTVYPTQKPGDASEKLKNLDLSGCDRLVVCGGDGMLHEALNGWMAGKNMPLLGYIPSGTVNDFANSHEIPLKLSEAAEIAGGDWWAPIDVGQFNEEYFSYVAAFGLGTSVSYLTAQERKNRLGSIASVLEALGRVDFAHWENNCETLEIEWEGGSLQGDFLYGMVSNSRYIAGSDLFTRNIYNWHDGLLEGVFIKRPMNISELNQIISCLMRSSFDNPLMMQVQSPWFRLKGENIPWTLDGEYGGVHDIVEARAVSSALNLALPKSHVQEAADWLAALHPDVPLALPENPASKENAQGDGPHGK